MIFPHSPSSRFFAKASSALLGAILGLPAATIHAQTSIAAARVSDEVVVLDRLDVSANQADPATPLSASEALRALSNSAGSVSVIDSSLVARGRVGTAADVLAFQPGVFAQSTGGQDALRVSIRGSGLNRGQGSFREGITFLFDGLPLTGPGGSPYELFEPLGLAYTEILRGANGSRYGGLSLGGAINYTTKTGYDSSAFEGRVEAGSFGYRKGQIASGQVLGNADYYATVVGSEREGFQDLTEGHSARVIANYGYKFNDKVSNRVFLRYGATTFENPGNLTVAQVEKDPTQANPGVVANARNPLYKSSRIQQGSTWVADKLSITPTPDSRLDLGFVFHDYPIDIQGTTASLGNVTAAQKAKYPFLVLGSPVANNTVGGPSLGGIRSVWAHDDVTLSARYNRTDTVFDRTSISTVGVLSTTEVVGKVTTYTDISRVNKTQTRDYKGSSNHVLFVGNKFEFLPKFWSLLDAQLIFINREAEYTFLRNPVQAARRVPGGPIINTPRDFQREVTEFAPRFGLRYDFTPELQVFGNISRAVEPADSWKYSAITNSSSDPQSLTGWVDLREQISDTVEVGTRARAGAFEGGVTVFRSWITDELLQAIDPTDPAGVRTTNFNADDTIHQGIEVALNTILWQDGGIDWKAAGPTRLSYRQAYTLNDFYFEDNKKELPALPRQFYQGELVFDHSSGFYVGASTQISSGYFVDYANTFEAPAYTLFGAKIGYVAPKGKWEVFLDFRNLTDENYITAASPVFDTRPLVGGTRTGPGLDTANYQPGDGRSVFGGFSYKF